MGALRGNAGLVHGATTHTLGGPLRIQSYRRLGRRWTRESLDRSALGRTSLPVAQYEIVARCPYDDEPSGLIAAIEDAADNGTSLYYRPDLSDPSYQFELMPMDVLDAVEAVPDRLFGDFAYRWEVVARFRGVGTDFVPLVRAGFGIVASAIGGWAVDGGGANWLESASLGGLAVDPTITASGGSVRLAVNAIGYEGTT